MENRKLKFSPQAAKKFKKELHAGDAGIVFLFKQVGTKLRVSPFISTKPDVTKEFQEMLNQLLQKMKQDIKKELKKHYIEGA